MGPEEQEPPCEGGGGGDGGDGDDDQRGRHVHDLHVRVEQRQVRWQQQQERMQQRAWFEPFLSNELWESVQRKSCVVRCGGMRPAEETRYIETKFLYPLQVWVTPWTLCCFAASGGSLVIGRQTATVNQASISRKLFGITLETMLPPSWMMETQRLFMITITRLGVWEYLH